GPRLDDVAELEQVDEQLAVGLELEDPGQHIRVEQVPVLWPADARADLGPGLDQAFGGENTDRFAVSAARDLQAIACRHFAAQEIARLEAPGHDQNAQIACNGAVQT